MKAVITTGGYAVRGNYCIHNHIVVILRINHKIRSCRQVYLEAV